MSKETPIDSLPVRDAFTRSSAELKLHENAMEVIERYARNRDTVIPKHAIQFVQRGDNAAECTAVCTILGLLGGVIAFPLVGAATDSKGLATMGGIATAVGGTYACKHLCDKETLTVGGMNFKEPLFAVVGNQYNFLVDDPEKGKEFFEKTKKTLL